MSEIKEETQNETALTNVSEQNLETAARYGLTAPKTLEEAALFREMLEADASLDAMDMDSLNSKELLGIPLDLIDALFVDIPDKESPTGLKRCVRFLVIRQDTGEVITCLKSSNTFNDTYVNWFHVWRGSGRKRENMEFFENQKFIRAGNAAICLRKIKPVEKAVGKR